MKKNKIHFIILGFGFLCLILIVFCVFPLIDGIKRDSNNLISVKNDISGLKVQKIESDKFKNNFDSYKDNLQRVNQLFVDQNNPVDFIKFLENSAQDSKITSQISLPASDNFQQAGQNFIIFNFSSKGKISDVLDFVKKIESGAYLVEVENLTIQNSENITSKDNIYKDYQSRMVDANMVIKTFSSQND